MNNEPNGSTAEREKIIKFAQQKFFREGFYKSTMDELAKELQISKKTIYKYFPSKEKLVEEISSDLTCSTDSEIAGIIEARENVVWKFVKILKMYSHRLVNFSDKWRHDLQVHSPYIFENLTKYRSEKIYSILNKLIEQGKKEKLIKNFPNEIIIACFNSTIQSVVNPEFILINKFSMYQAFVFTFEMLLSGILTQKGLEKFNKMKEEFEIEFQQNI